VNLGGDTDTIGAVTGAVVGARFGAASLPERWLSVLDRADELCALGEELAELQPPSASG
jgi:ADP-ribosyl-[dinitrogen reductase] hydrolase